MARGYSRRTVGVHLYLVAGDKPVASEDKFVRRVPYQQLLTRRIHGVEAVDVAVLACSAAGGAECDFAQSSYFTHHIGRVESVDYIYFVAPFVCFPQEPVGSQFFLNQVDGYGVNYFFFHHQCCALGQVRLLSYRLFSSPP